MVYELKRPQKAAALFEGWEETMLWSCLQGVMGKIYVDSLGHPVSAMAWLGDFCFFAGEPNKELVLYEPGEGGRDFMIMVPRSEGWAAFIRECYRGDAKEVVRYAFLKEPDAFDQRKLQKMVEELPDGCTLKMIDEELFWHCRKIKWCQDWTAQYCDYAVYQKYGLGVAVMKDGELISGASSYSGYRGGIEIQIDTREDYRRKGLARICGAKLILECLERGWYPSWDAQNQWSVALAGKLGYHFACEYAAFEVTRDHGKV